jgi:hypothetical protein
MERVAKPFEYFYISNTWSSSGEDFFRLIIQDFCLKGILNISLEWIELHPSEKHLRLRPFIGIGDKSKTYSTDSLSEKFIIDFFKDEPPLRTYQIRDKIKKVFSGNVEIFKKEYVYPDLKNAKLCITSFLISSEGRKEKRKIKNAIEFIDRNVYYMIDNKKQELILLLYGIETNVVYLAKDTIKALKPILPNLKDIVSSEIFNQDYLDLTNLTGLGYLCYFDSFDTFDSGFDTGGFDFGGGAFGGGGAEGSW